jgi:hypothetical protein
MAPTIYSRASLKQTPYTHSCINNQSCTIYRTYAVKRNIFVRFKIWIFYLYNKHSLQSVTTHPTINRQNDETNEDSEEDFFLCMHFLLQEQRPSQSKKPSLALRVMKFSLLLRSKSYRKLPRWISLSSSPELNLWPLQQIPCQTKSKHSIPYCSCHLNFFSTWTYIPSIEK